MNERETRRRGRDERIARGRERSTDGGVLGLERRTFLKAAAVGAGALALGSTPGAAQSIEDESCEGEYEEFEVGGGNFAVLNNQWTSDATEQCIYVRDDGSYGWTFEAPNGGPNYPEVYIGERPWGEDTGVSEFQDLQRGDVDELTVEYDFDLDINPNAEWNLALEWWLMSEPVEPVVGGGEPPHTHEIMLVLDHSDHHSHGGIQEHDVWTDRYGNTVHLWDDDVNGGTSARFLVFVLDQRSQSGTIDLTELIDFLTERYGVSADRYFTGLELGTEIWEGAGGDVHVNSFDVTINGTEYASGSGSGTEPEPPVSPDDAWTDEVTGTTVDLEWAAVDGADRYAVFLDGEEVETTSSTSATLTALSPDTSYEVGVAAGNDEGWSSTVETTVTTDDEEPGDVIEVGEYEAQDTTGDGLYEDVNGDGTASQQDVAAFFEHIESDAVQGNPEAFNFDGDGGVGFSDIVALFQRV